MISAFHDPIDWSAPIDWSHSNNKGRDAWWLVTDRPGWRGGKTWRDLVRYREGNIVTDPTDPVGGKWTGSSRPGSMGQIVFSGGNEYVDISSIVMPAGNFTIAAWVRPDTVTANQDTNCWFSSGSTNIVYGCYFSVGGGHVNFFYGATSQSWLTGVASVPADVWTRVVCVLRGTTREIYVNGRLDVTGTVAGTLDWGTTRYIGRRVDAAVNPATFIGAFDDISIYDRALTETEILNDWRLSPLGNPGVLRRWEPSLATTAAAVTTTVLLPSAIDTAESIGTAAVLPGAVDLTATGIATSEAVGTPAVLRGAVVLAPAGVATVEAFGTASAVPGAVLVSPAAIASAEASGTALLTTGAVAVRPTGIGTSEVFGSDTAVPGTVFLSPVGIGTVGAFGTAAAIPGATAVAPAGLPTAESWGVAVLVRGPVSVQTIGIAPAEAFGVAVAVPGAVALAPAAIGPAEAAGSPVISSVYLLGPGGVVSLETFGTARVLPGAAPVVAMGIVPAEGFGSPVVLSGGVLLQPVGIGTAEGLGVPLLATGGTVLTIPAIGPAEAFGTLAIGSAVLLSPGGIGTAEAIGDQFVSSGAVLVALAGIGTAEGFGAPAAVPGAVSVLPVAIASAEALGLPVVASGTVVLQPGGIAPAEAFGAVLVRTGVVAILPSAVASSEAFGSTVVLSGGVLIQPGSIVPAEAFGVTQLAPGTVGVSAAGIGTVEDFGTVSVLAGRITLQPVPIGTDEAFGTVAIVTGGVSVVPVAVVPAEMFGIPAIFRATDQTIIIQGIEPAGAFGEATRIGSPVLFPPDHLAAFLQACSLGPLALEFGETDPDWYPKFHRDEVMTDTEPPYLVARYDVVGEADPPSNDGITVQPQWLRIDVFANTQADSIRLARGVLGYFGDDQTPGPVADFLQWESGKEIERRIDRPDPVPIPSQRGPAGTILAGSRIRIGSMIEYSIFGASAWRQYVRSYDGITVS